MEFSKKKMKKAPLPWALSSFDFDRSEPTTPKESKELKLLVIMRNSFNRIFVQEKRDRGLSSSERKEWGNFLLERGIMWEMTVPSRLGNFVWEGWENCGGVPTRIRPKGLERHVKVNRYYVPEELAIRMLALGDLL